MLWDADRIDLAMSPIGAYAPRWFMKTLQVREDERAARGLEAFDVMQVGEPRDIQRGGASP